MHSILLALLPLLSLSRASAQSTTCSATTQCPQETPCCSEFGGCGSGSFCLGGCNPYGSYSINSCKPMPVCQSTNDTFSNTSKIQMNATQWDGDASKYDWVLEQGQLVSTNTSGPGIVLTLTETNQGTRLSSTRFVHYGTITARLKAGKWGGVVLGFITMSSIHDEIDWEWPGNQTTQAQENWFWQGGSSHPNTVKGLSDVSENYHDYTIDWKPDALTFYIDGQAQGSVKASDYLNNSVSQYPNTPSRVQFSLWPAGISSSASGTVQWAGGMINWNDSDYVSKGAFQVTIQSISIQCADPTTPSSGVTSYVYGESSSQGTPNITFSSASTTIDLSSSQNNTSTSPQKDSGSSSGNSGGTSTGGQSSSNNKSLASKFTTPVIVGIAAGGTVALLLGALAICMCMRKFSGNRGLGNNAQSYQPLGTPAPPPVDTSYSGGRY